MEDRKWQSLRGIFLKDFENKMNVLVGNAA